MNYRGGSGCHQAAKQVAIRLPRVKYIYIKDLTPRLPGCQLFIGRSKILLLLLLLLLLAVWLAAWGSDTRFWAKNGQVAKQCQHVAAWQPGVYFGYILSNENLKLPKLTQYNWSEQNSMKNWTKKRMEKAFQESGISDDVVSEIDFCLKQLCKDKTKCIEDEIVHGLTFEELLGALVDSRKTLQREPVICDDIC